MSETVDALTEKWQTYLFLTEEMKKFILRNETELFNSLLDQREALQGELSALMNEQYAELPERRELLQRVHDANQEMLNTFLAVFNAMKRKEQMMQLYEGGMQFTGNYLNQQR